MSNISRIVDLFVTAKDHLQKEIDTEMGKEGLTETQKDQIQMMHLQRDMALENMMMTTVGQASKSEQDVMQKLADNVGR